MISARNSKEKEKAKGHPNALPYFRIYWVNKSWANMPVRDREIIKKSFQFRRVHNLYPDSVASQLLSGDRRFTQARADMPTIHGEIASQPVSFFFSVCRFISYQYIQTLYVHASSGFLTALGLFTASQS